MDGSEVFYRNWEDYSEGFGNLDGEFWLGKVVVLNVYFLKYNVFMSNVVVIFRIVKACSTCCSLKTHVVVFRQPPQGRRSLWDRGTSQGALSRVSAYYLRSQVKSSCLYFTRGNHTSSVTNSVQLLRPPEPYRGSAPGPRWRSPDPQLCPPTMEPWRQIDASPFSCIQTISFFVTVQGFGGILNGNTFPYRTSISRRLLDVS